mgnify:CR=1 FL=1
MIEEAPPQTPIEISRSTTGFRYYLVDPAVYPTLAAGVDEARQYPTRHTLRGLPPVDELADAVDGVSKMIQIQTWRFNEADDEMLSGALESGAVVELTQTEWFANTPQEEPFLEVDPDADFES